MEHRMEWTGPLILTGASRSGTAMLRSILNAHSDIGLSGETHYFDDLRERCDTGASLQEEEQHRFENYFRALDDRPYGMNGNPQNSPLPPGSIIERAMMAGGRPDDFFESYCRLTSERTGKSVWGEKTPRHVFRIGDILGCFPEARVVCMVRDPRAAVASYRHWRSQGGLNAGGLEDFTRAIERDVARARKSYNIIIATTLWKASVKAAMKGRAEFGSDKVLVQRYEDILMQPEQSVRKICDWLGIHYEPSMLSVPMHNSSFIPFAEQTGISRAPLDRWRTTLAPHEISVIEKVAGQCLIEAGYTPDGSKVSVPLYALEWLKVGPAALRAATVNRGRIGSLPSYVWRRLAFAWR